MSTVNGVVVAIVVAAIVFSICFGWGYNYMHKELFGPSSWDSYRLGQLTCLGAPAWTAIAGAIVFWVLGTGRKAGGKDDS